MRLLKYIFTLFLVITFCLANADNPKAGRYFFHYLNEATGKETDFSMTLSARKQNWQITGSLPGKNQEVITFSGTLFGSSLKIKGTWHYTDSKGKKYEGPINGDWNYSRNSVGLWAGTLNAEFTRIGSKSNENLSTFTGTWDSSFGKMTLTQSGKKVSGTYDYHGGTVDGEIRSDGRLYFKWTQTDPTKQGTGFFSLSGDGNSFSGSWDYTNASGAPLNNGGGWSGKRKV